MGLRTYGNFTRRAVLVLTFLMLPAAVRAGAPTTVFTTLVVQPGTETVVAAGPTKQQTKWVTFDVALDSLPPRAKLEHCVLRLVTMNGVPAGVPARTDGGIVVQLVDTSAGGATPKPGQAVKALDTRQIKTGTPAGAELRMESARLCESLMEGPAGARKLKAKVQFRLQTTTPNASIGFYGRPEEALLTPVNDDAVAERATDKINFAPRLLLTYQLPDSFPGRAEWSQARADAQHSGRSDWRFYNQDDTYTPKSFTFRQLGGPDAQFADIYPPRVVMYGRQLLAVRSDSAAIQVMDGFGGLVKSLPITVKPKFIAVSQFGWLYRIGEGKIVVQRIDSGEERPPIPIGGSETVTEPPTIGAGGNFYVVASQYLYAYPAPPAPTVLPLWRHRIPATQSNDVSSVAVSQDGQTVYIVVKDKASMLAFDAATGKEKWQVAGLQISKGNDEPMPIPVVAGRRIFVTDRALASGETQGKLYVVKDEGSSAVLDPTSPAGAGISAPVVAPDGSSVYFLLNHLPKLLRLADGDIKTETVGGFNCENASVESDLLRIDQSGNLYALRYRNDSGAFVFIGANKDLAPKGACLPFSVPYTGLAGDLVIGPDGAAYIYTNKDNRLMAIVPQDIGNGNSELILNNGIFFGSSGNQGYIEKNNDTTFRARTVVVDGTLALPADTNINIIAQDKISFAPGFRIHSGGTLRARTGF